MSKKIIVPLDGSAQAEKGLPIAVLFATACQGEIVLLHILRGLEESYELSKLRIT